MQAGGGGTGGKKGNVEMKASVLVIRREKGGRSQGCGSRVGRRWSRPCRLHPKPALLILVITSGRVIIVLSFCEEQT